MPNMHQKKGHAPVPEDRTHMPAMPDEAAAGT